MQVIERGWAHANKGRIPVFRTNIDLMLVDLRRGPLHRPARVAVQNVRGALGHSTMIAVTHLVIVDRLSALPGVIATSALACLPLSEQQLCQGGPLFIDGHLPSGYDPALHPDPCDRRRLLSGDAHDRTDVDCEEPSSWSTRRRLT